MKKTENFISATFAVGEETATVEVFDGRPWSVADSHGASLTFGRGDEPTAAAVAHTTCPLVSKTLLAQGAVDITLQKPAPGAPYTLTITAQTAVESMTLIVHGDWAERAFALLMERAVLPTLRTGTMPSGFEEFQPPTRALTLASMVKTISKNVIILKGEESYVGRNEHQKTTH